ncbi:MAG: DNA damage-inducible protein D [Phycisphaerales bacterium]|nr:DNA damage-inducible protein D [Phycisphaerales bacterium]MBT7170888.1 DNA damage-inducible protein D [Phycisphaerales bacterium]
MENNIERDEKSVFSLIRYTSEEGVEFWAARLFGKLLGYAEYRNFLPVIDKAKTACKNSGHDPAEHFEVFSESVQIGSGASREMDSIALSRYACYLVVQNADPAKPIVAEAQTYFAVQTRRQELSDEGKDFVELQEGEKRILLRDEVKKHNSQLVEAAKGAGVKTNLDYAIFQNHGYKGLYGGLDAKGIHRRKGLKRSQKILDHMGSTELAANLFRATQAEEKLRREKIQGKQNANKAHYEVGKKVRETIEDIGGTMPEELPVAESIKVLERQKKKELENRGE